MTETIYALSTPAGKAGLAVIRVSGDGAFRSYAHLTRAKKPPQPRRAVYKKIYNPADGEVLDHALILCFKGPESFTGEDVVEYHVHGSPAIISHLYRLLSMEVGHRLAAPGEFTRRSFENGKTDLTAAEAIADLIDAQTELQRRQAVRQMGGALCALYEGWRDRLIRAMAYVEAVIDFPDEDIPDSETAKAIPAIKEIATEISNHLSDHNRGERLRDGITLCLLGAPNAGKSTLMNAIARRDVAIVSPMAGTTRDMIEVALDLSGFPVIMVDTAGLRLDQAENVPLDTQAGIEQEGIGRALLRAQSADLKLFLFDGTAPVEDKILSLVDTNSLCLITKNDLGGGDAVLTALLDKSIPQDRIFRLCAKDQKSLDGFIAALTHILSARFSIRGDEPPTLTRARHRTALVQCHENLLAAMAAAAPELMSEHLRRAARALGQITGRVDVEDLLDVVFRDFCIGK